MQLISFKIFEGHDVVCGLSTRLEGVSTGPFESLNLDLESNDKDENVQENYRRFFDALKIERKDVVLPYQRHTDEVIYVTEGGGLDQVFDAVDGFVTDKVGVGLLVRFADCQGVFIYDPVKRIVCAVHSGWRGNAQNILGKSVRKLVMEFGCNAENLLVGVSPSLGACCSEFSEPMKELPEEMHQFIDGKFVDLWACSRRQLMSEGVLEENIEFDGRCTKCHPELFFSYRGEKPETGRMSGVIYLA